MPAEYVAWAITMARSHGMEPATPAQSDVPVETVTKYLLETPGAVEMVSLNLGYGVRWAFRGHSVPGEGRTYDNIGPRLNWANRRQY